MKCPFEVVAQQAAVRPILRDQKPAVGREHSRIFHFNGLGSKGALQAPWVAARLADHILTGATVPPEIDSRRFRARRRIDIPPRPAVLF